MRLYVISTFLGVVLGGDACVDANSDIDLMRVDWNGKSISEVANVRGINIEQRSWIGRRTLHECGSHP